MSVELWVLVITGVGGIALGLYNSATGARRGVVEELRGLISELRSLYDAEKKQRMELEDELESVRVRIKTFESKNRALWHYVYELIDFIKRQDVTPPTPPLELETDEKLARLVKR
jgi:hypothetical protein